MTTAEDVSFHGETATLVVSQARSPIALGCAENTVLLEQVVNDRLLTSINPAREQQEKEGERGRELVVLRQYPIWCEMTRSDVRREPGSRPANSSIGGAISNGSMS